MIFIRNAILCCVIFLAGFFLGNYYVLENTKQLFTPQQNKINEEKVITDRIEKNSIKQKNVSVKETNSSTPKTYTMYELFESYLDTSRYEAALTLYQKHATDETMEKYQSHFFEHLQSLIIQKDPNSIKVIRQFLSIEPDNLLALYLQSKIYFQNGRTEAAIAVLENIKIYELEIEFEKKVLNDLDKYTTVYVNDLQKRKNFNKLIPFLQNIIDESPNETRYVYLLAKINFDLKNYENAKELLEQILSDDIYANKASMILSQINKKLNPYQEYSHKIALEKKGTHYYLKALLNDEKEVRLLLDTGASITLIDKSIINEIEHTVLRQSVKLNTAGGTISAAYVQLQSFVIEDTMISDMKVVSSVIKKNGFDGLLGMNYLKEFDFYIDQKEAVLYLNRK